MLAELVILSIFSDEVCEEGLASAHFGNYGV